MLVPPSGPHPILLSTEVDNLPEKLDGLQQAALLLLTAQPGQRSSQLLAKQAAELVQQLVVKSPRLLSTNMQTVQSAAAWLHKQ